MQFDSGNFEQDLGSYVEVADEDSIWPTLYINVVLFAVGAVSTVGVDLITSSPRGERNSEKWGLLCRIWQRAWKADHKSIYQRPSIKFQMEATLEPERPAERRQLQVERYDAADSDSAQIQGADLLQTPGAGPAVKRESQSPAVRGILKSASRQHRLSTPAGGAVMPLTLPSQHEGAESMDAAKHHGRAASPDSLLRTPEARPASFHPGSASSARSPAILQSNPEDCEAASGRAPSKSLPSRVKGSLLTVPHPLGPEKNSPRESDDRVSPSQKDLAVDARASNDESNDASEGVSSSSSSSSSAAEQQGMPRRSTARSQKSIVPGLAAHTSYTNYLCFLKVCQAMFATLSFLSVIFMMPRAYWWGCRPFFGGTIGGRISLVHPKNSFEPDLDRSAVVLLYIQTWLFGVVILIFTQLLQASCNDMPIVDIDVAEKINRTVWFKWLPTGDKRTRREFLMSDADMERVADDLKYAIEERLTKIHWRQRFTTFHRDQEDGASTASWAEAAWDAVSSSMYSFNKRGSARFSRSNLSLPSQNLRTTHGAPLARDSSVANSPRFERERSSLPNMRADEADLSPMTSSYSEPRSKVDRRKQSQGGALERVGLADRLQTNFSTFIQGFGDNTFTSSKSQTWRIEPRSLTRRQCVESVEVPPETAQWHQICMKLRDATERADSYSELESKYRILAWWYRRRARKCTDMSKHLRTQLLKLIMHNKRLCGSAFVTFTSVEEKSTLLKNDKPRWWDVKRFQHGYSHFTFGRPPFASVTLKCEPAPHPNDIQWANLHKSPFERQLRFIFGVTLITGALALLVTPNTLKGLFLEISRLMRPERKNSRTLEFWFKKGITSATARFLHVLWRPMVGRLLSLSLLFINSLILPYAIQYLAEAERCPRKSTVERRALRLNFMFMVLNIVLMPMLQVTSIQELTQSLTDLTMTNGLKAVLGYVGDRMSQGHGVFTIQYLINATFISSAVALAANIRQKLVKEITLAFFAVTDRDRDDAHIAELFTWGYWYAWALAIICMTMIICVLVPGTLPIATLLFTMRYHIDRYNLDNGVFELGSESNGAFVRTVVHHMRLIVSIMWFLMGCFFLTETVQAIGLQWISEFGSYALCVASLVLGVGNTYQAMYSFWWTKMTEMYHSEKWMERIQGRVGRLQAAQSSLSRFLHDLQDKLQLTRSIVGCEHLLGSAEDINWKVLETKEYIWADSLVETMLQVLHERCREDGSFNFTTKNLEKYGLETSELTQFFDIDEGGEDEEHDSEDDCMDSIELESYMDKVRSTRKESYMDRVRTNRKESYMDNVRSNRKESYMDNVRSNRKDSYMDKVKSNRRQRVDEEMQPASTWSGPFSRKASQTQTLQSLHV